MTHPTTTIEQRLQAIESQLEALATEKEQLLEAQISQDKERLDGLADKVRAACEDDETYLEQCLPTWGTNPLQANEMQT